MSNEDSSDKWLFIFLTSLFMVGFIYSGVELLVNSAETREAIRSGYVQVIDEKTGEKLWVKDDSNVPE